MLVTILAFLIVLSVLVLIHELGHFITALLFGMKVEEFGFGFPPRALSFKRKGIVYSINWLPIGGFVKLYGEDDAGGGKIGKSKEVGSSSVKKFTQWPAWKRFTVVFAGVVMNFFLAVFLISYLFSAKGVAIPTENIKIVEVTKGSPAQASGIKNGDQVLTVNGKRITNPDEFVSLTHQQEGKKISIRIKRDNQNLEVSLIPRKQFPKGEGPLGVAISNVELKKYVWYKAPFYGTIEAFKFSWLILSGLGTMVAGLAHGQKPAGIAGPIGVAQLTGQAVSYGLTATLWFVAVLSLNLAVVNVLPIPALDGGRLFFILIEIITKRRVSPKYEAMAHAVGLAVLLSLILLITLFDVARIATGQSLLPKM